MTPLYRQLADRIRQWIYRGEMESGGQIPTEAELIARYGVSHITVRRAMQELSNEGLLIRTRGKGTFVNPSIFTGAYNYLFIHGLEMDGLAYPFTARLLNGISRQNSERVHFRLETLALPPRGLQDGEDQRVDDLLSHTKIHGIITLPRLRFETLERLVARGVFVVQIGQPPAPPPGVVAIQVSSAARWKLIAEYLRRTGRSRIAYIAQPDMRREWLERLEFQIALRKEGLALDDLTIEVATWGINAGRAAAERLLQRCDDLDAIVASDDLQAVGALLAAGGGGRRVGTDLAVIGQSNILGEHSHCGLTTIDTRIDDCGALAVQTLERLLKGEKVDSILRLEPKLIVRQTG